MTLSTFDSAHSIIAKLRPCSLSSCAAAWLSMLMGLLLSVSLYAEQPEKRPSAPKLFPDKTLAYFRIQDVRQLKQDLEQISLGKLANDPQLKPILDEFYGTMVQSTQQLAEAVGLNLDDLLSIPSGELAVAVFATGRNRAQMDVDRTEEGQQRVSARLSVSVALLIDAGEEISKIQVLLGRMEQAMDQQFEHLQKNVDRLTLHSFRNTQFDERQFAYFIDGGTIVACTNVDYIEDLAAVWLGNQGDRKTLADNDRFVSIMSRSVGAEGERPQVTFFVDPVAMIREFTPKSGGGILVLSLLGPLGIDSLEALGGSWIVAPKDFDHISHFHISLSSPRRGIMASLRPQAGSVTPETWVPSSTAAYTTLNWDIQATVQAIERLFNQLRGDGAFDQQVLANISGRLGVDVRKDVLANLEGRVSLLQGYVRPIAVNSGSNVYAIRLKNAKYFEANVLPKIVDSIRQNREISSESFGKIRAQVMEFNRPSQGNAPVTIRNPEICLAVVDEYLIISDSRYMLRQMSDAQSDPQSQLRESLEYQLINDRIKAQLQDKKPSAISFARPEETLQLFYELARDNKNLDSLKRFADRNPIFQSLNAALQKHELPPFSVITKYLAPNGGYLVEEELGLHYTRFSLQRE